MSAYVFDWVVKFVRIQYRAKVRLIVADKVDLKMGKWRGCAVVYRTVREERPTSKVIGLLCLNIMLSLQIKLVCAE